MSDSPPHNRQSGINSLSLKRLERRMYTAFGSMIALMITIVLLSAGAYFQYALSKAQEDLSTVLTRILSDSVSRISFSGKYQARLLLEDIKREQPEIAYLLIADRNGLILAHSDPAFDDTRLNAASLQEAFKVVRGSPREIRALSLNGVPVREVTLPYRSGIDHQPAGVIQVGLADKKLLSAVIRGGWFALTLGIVMLSVGLTIGFIYINNHFVRPVRLMAAQLEGILTNAPTLIAIRDKSGAVVNCSAAFRKFFSLAPHASGLNNAEIYPPDDAATVDQYLEQIRQYKTPVQFEISATDTQGDERTFLVTGFPILSEQGEVQLIGSFGVDLTELRATEKALRNSLAEAERASASKSEFLSRMSHELRTPLNAIIGFSQVLQNDPIDTLTEEQNDNVEEILRAGRHLLELINEILDLARIESGHLEISLSQAPVSQLFDECRSLITPMASRRGITLVTLPCCTTDCCSCLLICDLLRTRQILINLLSNAVKYNRENGFITLGCSRVSERGCRIIVQDTGNGIEPDFLGRLFEPFARDIPVGSGVEGTGIGLALAKRLVEAMGGRIGVESRLGVGSLFWFELPSAAAMQPKTLPDAAPEAALEQQPSPTAGHHTVLSIEDDPANRRLIRKLLSNRASLTMLEAGSAEDGLELVRNCRVDLILMDINLPGMDGFEALAALRCAPETASIPVIAISANAMQNEIDDALAAGFAAYLIKPVDLSQLLLQIDNCITPHEEDAS